MEELLKTKKRTQGGSLYLAVFQEEGGVLGLESDSNGGGARKMGLF